MRLSFCEVYEAWIISHIRKLAASSFELLRYPHNNLKIKKYFISLFYGPGKVT